MMLGWNRTPLPRAVVDVAGSLSLWLPVEMVAPAALWGVVGLGALAALPGVSVTI